MKRLKRSLTLGLSLLIAQAVYAGSLTYRIFVSGLACPFCAYGLERQIGKIDGVKDMETDVGAGAITVTMAEGETLGKEEASKAVKKAGFTLGDLEEISSKGEGEGAGADRKRR